MHDRLSSPADPETAIPPNRPHDGSPPEVAALPVPVPAQNHVARKRSWRLLIAVLFIAAVVAPALKTIGGLLRPAAEGPSPTVNLASIGRPIPLPEEPEKISQRLNDSAAPTPGPRAEATGQPPDVSEQATAGATDPLGASSAHGMQPAGRAETAGGTEYDSGTANVGSAATLATAGPSVVEQRIAQAMPSGPPSQVASPTPAAAENAAAALEDINAYPNPGATAPRAPENGLAACLAARPTELQLPPDEIARLVEGGEAFLRQARVSAARQMFQRAADACDWRAAIALATTYDPVMLRKLGAALATPDIATARAWYERAKQLGSTEASQYLERLSLGVGESHRTMRKQ